MKLTVPAIRVAEPDAQRLEAAEHTVQLLREIDALLAEIILPASVPAAHGGGPRAAGHGPRRPVSPAAA